MTTKVQRLSHKFSKSNKRMHRNKKTKKFSRSKKHLKNMRGGGINQLIYYFIRI